MERSFVAGLGSDPSVISIVRAAQLGSLRGLACDRGQGFWFSRPLPAPAMEALLGEGGGGRLVLEGPAP